MNFLCSDKIQDLSELNFTTHQATNGWYIHIDKGWTRTDNYFFKGFETSWCKIHFDPTIKIETNTLRDFPIYYNKDSVTNCRHGETTVPVDGVVEITDKIKINYTPNFYPATSTATLSFQECHNILFDCIVENVESFAKNNGEEVFVPAQGGIDTLTVRSVFDYLGLSYSLFDLPATKPKASNLKSELIAKYWGFSQVAEMPKSVLVTGFYGDEWILRNPYYVHLLLSERNIDLVEVFDSTKDCYMKQYFENYRAKCKTNNQITKKELASQICNDFQIWHINDTKFFSPLKHIKLLQLLSADNQTIIGQVTDAKLSKSIIAKCNPSLLKLLDSKKNIKDPNYFWQD